MRAPALALLLLAASACGRWEPRPAASPATVSLRLRGEPADATVTIDDRVLGPLSYVALRGVALPPGDHRITVSAPGYFPVDREIHAREGDAPIAIEAVLVRVPE